MTYPSPAFTPRSIVAVSKRQVSCSHAEGLAVLQCEQGTCYGLDAVGARIWELMAAPRAIESILDTLVREYEVDRARCEADLIRLLDELARQGLIEVVAPEGSGS